MELRQLKYFVKTAELLNFSEAARNLYITQSTLSQQIKQLEAELGTQLFERNTHGVVLTESGEELLPYARKTLHPADSCVEHIRDIKNVVTGSLNIGVTYTFSPILTETLLSFMKLYPNVKLNIFYKTMEELMAMLDKRDLDFVLAFKPTGTAQYARISSHILFDNHLVAIVSESHPLAKRQKVTLEELQGYDFALPSKGLQARNAFDSMVEGKAYRFNTRIELNEVNILLKLVRESNLVTIVSEATIYGVEGIHAVRLDVPGNTYEMEGCIHVLKDSYQKSSAKKFVQLLSESDSIKERAFNWLSSGFME